MMLFFLICIGLLIYFFTNQGKIVMPEKNTPEKLLKERFIRGDIDEKTYLQMKETIKG